MCDEFPQHNPWATTGFLIPALLVFFTIALHKRIYLFDDRRVLMRLCPARSRGIYPYFIGLLSHFCLRDSTWLFESCSALRAHAPNTAHKQSNADWPRLTEVCFFSFRTAKQASMALATRVVRFQGVQTDYLFIYFF